MSGSPPNHPADTPPAPVRQLCFDARGKQVARDDPAFSFEWFHLRRGTPEAADWLAQAGLSPVVVSALTAEETRPRCTVDGHGVLINLRGVNLMEGADPEDMVSVRFYVEDRRVIGVWHRPLHAVTDLLAAVARGQGPTSPGDLVAKVALRLADRVEPIVAALNDRIDDLEEQVLDERPLAMRKDLGDIRRMAIVLRRFMFPQRDALTTLEIEDLDWLTGHDRNRVREAAERTTRLAEELEAIRERATVVQEQIMDMRAETMNRTMLLLAVVTATFLPLGLITGALGINVGGIPGADNSHAFWIVCALLLALGGLQLALFKWMRLF
jgi:zinc transporter